jgi:NADPH-dependent ferric siderophore reductase
VIEAPRIERIRHEPKRRQLTVVRVERLPPAMIRVVLAGDELAGFTSSGSDDHVKLFFPAASGVVEKRDFTPRRHDAATGELWIDFYLHDAGPASAWAAQAATGQQLTVGGPKGSAVIPMEGIAMHLLIGDETGLPAIGRRLEELPTTARAVAVVESADDVAGPVLRSRAALQVIRVPHRSPDAAPAAEIIAALAAVDMPTPGCFAWVAHESKVARAIRTHLCTQRGFDKRWIKAAGYWQRGVSGAHDKIPDED